MEFETIVSLSNVIQCVKRKYPMVVSHAKHLQKIAGDERAMDKEVASVRAWLLSNEHLADRVLDNTRFVSSKLNVTVDFGSVFAQCSDDIKSDVLTRIIDLDRIIFPNGRPKPVAVNDESATNADDTMSPGARAALTALEANPVFGDLVDTVKATVANLDSNDMGALLDSKDFGNLVKNIQSGVNSGKYKISDLSRTIGAVIDSVQDELDPEMKDVVSSAMNMMVAAERGEQPDVGALMNMVRNVRMQ